MSKLTRVFLIRHAEVENPRHLLYGHLPGFGLSRRGQAQAQALGRELAPRGLVRIVHSPLLRAAETAQLIAERSRSVRLAEDDRLTEAGFSRHLQGVPYWQVPFRRPLWTVHQAFPGWLAKDESIEAMGARLLAVLDELAASQPGRSTALVSHADPIQAAWILLNHRSRNELEMHRRRVQRAGMVEVRLEGSRLAGITHHSPPQGV